MSRVALFALLSYWRRHPLQLATLVLGLALATALWSGVQAINAEARKSYDQAATILGGSPVLVSADGNEIAIETFVALRRNGWLVSPVVEGWIKGDTGRVRLIGIDPLTATPGPRLAPIGEVGIRAFLGEGGAILAPPATAQRLGHLGDRVVPVDALAPGIAVADLDAALKLLNRTTFDRLTLAPSQPLNQPPLASVAPDLRLEQPETAQDIGRLTDSFHLNLTAFGFLSFAVGLFIVNGAVGLAFEQRRPMFRTLRALGVSARGLTGLLIGELLLIALVSGLIGIALGWLIAAALLPDVAATLRGLYGATVEGTLTLSPMWWVSGIAIAAIGTALASASTLLQMARLSPLAAARPRAWHRASFQSQLVQLAGSGTCFLAASLASGFGNSLTAGFIVLGGLLLGAALALPALLSALLLLLKRTFPGKAKLGWFWADTRHQLPGLSLALMALLLALSANVGVGTMVNSFRATFTGWLDQRLVSELYVTLESEEQIPGFRDFAATRSEAVLPIWSTDGTLLGQPVEISGIVNHRTYRENWPLLSAMPDVWNRLANNEGALVNEQLARREEIALGYRLPLPGRPEVLGIYSDYGNPLGQVILPLDNLATYYSDIDRLDFGLRVDPAALPELRRALVEEFGLPEANLTDAEALKAFSMSVFDRTFSVTGALNILTLGIAGLAMLTSLVTLASMRLPQLAPVWALGLSRREIARIEVIRSMFLALLTFILALPVGLTLGWVLLAVINVEAFGWRLPMALFPADWARLLALSLVTAALAGLWPARRIASRPPSDLIRVFSNER